MRQRHFELFQFLSRPVQFHPGQVGHGQHFGQELAHIGEMRQNPAGRLISFPAENLVPVDTEAVEKILGLARRLLHEAREGSLDRFELSRMRFKVGMQTDEIFREFHGQIVGLAGNPVDQRSDRSITVSTSPPLSSPRHARPEIGLALRAHCVFQLVPAAAKM